MKTQSHLNPIKANPMCRLFTLIQLLVLLVGATLSAYSTASATYSPFELEAEFSFNDKYAYVPGQATVLFVKPDFLASTPQTAHPDIAGLYSSLRSKGTSLLPPPKWVPIFNGGITLFIPNYDLRKVIGDNFVQTLFVRSQIKRLLGREVIAPLVFGDEVSEFATLYNNALNYAIETGTPFGTPLTQIDRDMIWPELRQIKGEWVYVPIVYLSTNTLNLYSVKGLETSLNGGTVKLGGINIGAGSELTLRNTFLNVANDLEVKGQLNIQDDAKVLVQGSLMVDGGTLLAKQSQTGRGNMFISAGDITIKSIVQVVKNEFGQTSNLGSIAKVESDGTMTLRSSGDITVLGANIRSNDTLVLGANGNISVKGLSLPNVFEGKQDGWDTRTTTTEYFSSTISSQYALQMIANGTISIEGSSISSDKGQLELLAGMGIRVEDHLNQTQTQRSNKYIKGNPHEEAYKTVAIRSLLEAGKNVVINSEMGDIVLKAAAITSQTGTSVKASAGGVQMLVSKETDQYQYSAVKNSLLTVTNINRGHLYENTVATSVVGGLQIQAQGGLTVEYKGDPTLSLEDQVAVLSQAPGMEWMNNVDKTSTTWKSISAEYKNWDKTQTSLSPAAMALISIAMAAASGGASLGATATLQTAMQAAVAAGVSALETQLVIAMCNGVVNGGNFGPALKQLTSDDSLKSLAISMVTAGALKKVDMTFFSGTAVVNGQEVVKDLSYVQQAGQAVTHAAVSSTVTWAIKGGDFASVRDSFVHSLAADAVNQLGKGMANKIGAAKSIDEATRYISQAALGCMTQGLTAKLSSTDAGDACLSGAGGALLAQGVADIVDAKTKTYTKALLEPSGDASARDSADFFRFLAAHGADVSRMVAGLSALAVGGDVNAAAAGAGMAYASNRATIAKAAALGTLMIQQGMLGCTRTFIECSATQQELGVRQRMKASGKFTDAQITTQVAAWKSQNIFTSIATYNYHYYAGGQVLEDMAFREQDDPLVRAATQPGEIEEVIVTGLRYTGMRDATLDCFAGLERLNKDVNGAVGGAVSYLFDSVLGAPIKDNLANVMNKTVQAVTQVEGINGAIELTNTVKNSLGAGSLAYLSDRSYDGAKTYVGDNTTVEERDHLAADGIVAVGATVFGWGVGKAVSSISFERYVPQAGPEKFINKKPKFSGDWDNYKTFGIFDDPLSSPEGRRMVIEFENGGIDHDAAIYKTRKLMETGSTLPIANPINVGDVFYKLVPNGATVGPKSVFWITEAEVSKLRYFSGVDSIADRLGVPLAQQQAASFSLYKVKAIDPGTSFTSRVAPTSELGADGTVWKQAGGAEQTLLTDRQMTKFSSPELIEQEFKQKP